MDYTDITTDKQLGEFCQRIANAPRIGFDTEFVSEDTYVPELCLVQVAAAGEMAVIDTLKVEDPTPLWELLAAGGHETIVHAGREEYLFCQRATGQRLNNLLDLQIAAGLIGLEYPASYSNLIHKLLGKSLGKGETRTDWRRRPLSKRQIEYAVMDVVYLEPMRDALVKRLDELGRLSWLEEETSTWQTNLEESQSRQRWRRVSGTSGLSPRSMAVVRELWQWREAEAERRNTPARRVLRDDLIVEMAKRQTDDEKRIRAVRGMNYRGVQPHLGDLAACVRRAMDLPDSELPRSQRRDLPKQLTMLGQFLNTALASVCHRNHVAPSLIGSVSDVRDFVAYELNINREAGDEPPKLAVGWRKEVVGDLIDDLLAGRLAIRIDDPLSAHPLTIQPIE